jgi:hypothetical protein
LILIGFRTKETHVRGGGGGRRDGERRRKGLETKQPHMQEISKE